MSAEEFAHSGLADWRFVLGAIHAGFRAGSFPAAATLVSTIAVAAEEADHHPDVDVRYPDRVRVALATHAALGLTSLDIDLARTISALAAEAGASSEPATAQRVEIAIDTMDPDQIRPFWAAVLGYEEVDGGLADPLRSGPPMWFQVMDEPRTDRDRFHIDVSVAHDEAADRIKAGLAAGGTLVSEDYAPAWWILADADGNEACICTWQGRAAV
ncbi:MAG: pterin-4-alpha-carbinolamine dehydratase [Actinomycetia bacterium]|nr:pterin-4-alpha-carbinolamine dehydratase [Actinomycetes bacterium]